MDMKTNVKKLLSRYSSLDFGKISLSRPALDCYGELNGEMIDLCRSLPDAARNRAMNFLLDYSRIMPGEKFDFFGRYYAPSWSILYHCYKIINTKSSSFREALRIAARGQALAMFLHSLDDHINDGDIPASHLTLLLRSAAWLRFNACMDYFSGKTPSCSAAALECVNDYYAGMIADSVPGSLDEYCELFRKQMATSLVMPLCLIKFYKTDDSAARCLRKSYESFGIAWRFLDDVNDLAEDLARATRSSIYFVLPELEKKLWSAGAEKNTIEFDRIVKSILERSLLDEIIMKIDHELIEAAEYAGMAGMPGLEREYESLRIPVAEFIASI